MKDYVSPYKENINERSTTPTKNFKLLNVQKVSAIPQKKQELKTPLRAYVTPVKTPEKSPFVSKIPRLKTSKMTENLSNYSSVQQSKNYDSKGSINQKFSFIKKKPSNLVSP